MSLNDKILNEMEFCFNKKKISEFFNTNYTNMINTLLNTQSNTNVQNNINPRGVAPGT